MATRIVLWGVPMCLSTVFTRCVNARGDAEIFVEPYDNCHSFGPERRIAWPDRVRSSELLNDWQTYEYTKELLERDYPAADMVFVKDMAFAVDGKYDMLPATYRHTFMIRQPVKVWSAYHKRIKQLLSGGGEDEVEVAGDLEGYASPTSVFKASFDLMEYARTELDQAPVVIDADDLVHQPGPTLREFCSAVGVPYKESMLEFASATHPGSDRKWHCSKFFSWGGQNGGFYAKAMGSKGFMSDTKEYKLSDLPPEVAGCVSRSQGWYERMHALRLKPEAT